jgi:predicted nucleic acid-binding protein
MSRNLYVESSALARILIEQDQGLAQAVAAAERLLTSALTVVETARAISRARRERRLTPAQGRAAERALASFGRAAHVLAVDDEVLEGARKDFPVEPIRTLDAIHLASILVLSRELTDDLEVATTDRRISENAAALGCGVVG